MNVLKDVVTLPFLGPLKGVTWIASKILEQAEQQLPGEGTIKRQLTELQLQFDLGEIAEDEFEQQEELLLIQLREIRNEDRIGI